MQLIDQPGGSVFVAEAPIWAPQSETLQGRDHLLIGVTHAAIEAKAQRGMRTHLGQLYGIVCPGLIMTKHVFQGLARGMVVGDNPNAAATKLAATWDAKRDATLVGPREDVKIEFSDAPPQRVFVVYISPNLMLRDFPLIYGWAEHWTWVAADPEHIGAPVDYESRYDRALWAA